MTEVEEGTDIEVEEEVIDIRVDEGRVDEVDEG